MADLGTVGANASARTGGTYRPTPGGLTSANYGNTGSDLILLPFTMVVTPTAPRELVGAVPI